jgi:hypothetical protein
MQCGTVAWQQPCLSVRVEWCGETAQEVIQEKGSQNYRLQGKNSGEKKGQSIPYVIPGVQHTSNVAGVVALLGHSAKQPSSGCP